MAPARPRKDTGLEEEFDDPDVKAFVRSLERLALDGANSSSEREHLLTVGLFLAVHMSTTKRSRLNCRLLEQMASVRRLPENTTEEERLLRASMIIESCAREFQNSGRRSVLVRLARRLAVETAEPKILLALKDEESAAFIAEALRQWGPTKTPRPRQKATNGVLGALAYRFELWGIVRQHEEDVRRAIASRIRAVTDVETKRASSRAASASAAVVEAEATKGSSVSLPSRKTRAKRR